VGRALGWEGYGPVLRSWLTLGGPGLVPVVRLVDRSVAGGVQLEIPEEDEVAELSRTLLSHRARLNEIAGVLARHGLASWAARGSRIADIPPVERLVHRALTPEELDATDGERLRDALTELGTTWIKFGQMLSLRPDVVGEEIATELGNLQAAVPADPPGVAQRTVEAQLGGAVGTLFGGFEPEPFASGSVAQVHRATLIDGTAVAVKVLHDGAEVKVRDDVELMKAIADYLEAEDPDIAQLRPTILVAEFATMMAAATDLRQELENLQRFRHNFAEETDVVIPTPTPELTGEKVLTMTMIAGQPFTDRASVEAVGWDVEALVHRAADVYLEMIFRDGLYHADPHPGNFLLPDDTHMAILDFGDVGRLSSVRQRQLETMVIAIGTHDVDALIDIVVELTTPPPGVDQQGLRASIETWLNRYLLVGVGNLDMAAIISSGMQLLHDNHLVLPADLALLFRVLLRLQGLGRGVGTEVRVTELLEPYVKKMLAERFDPRRIARRVSRSVRSWDHLIAALPDDLRGILEQIRTGKLGVDFRIHDADHAIDRLVDGLITAASVLAGAQLIARRASPTLGAFSIPGLVASGIGLVSWQRLVARRHPPRTWVTRAREMAIARR
jgi:ubiquinone biosynthesis protein